MEKNKIRKSILKVRKLKYDKNLAINFKNFKNLLIKKKIYNGYIGGYFPVNYEIDCLKILSKLETDKFKISLPKIKKNNLMDFFKYSFRDPLKLNKYGIPEPINNSKIYPDVIIVPLVAFNDELFRIGYGGGYYDRYIQKLIKKKKFLTIGFAFSFQRVPKFRVDTFDRSLDFIMTERKIYK